MAVINETGLVVVLYYCASPLRKNLTLIPFDGDTSTRVRVTAPIREIGGVFSSLGEHDGLSCEVAVQPTQRRHVTLSVDKVHPSFAVGGRYAHFYNEGTYSLSTPQHSVVRFAANSCRLTGVEGKRPRTPPSQVPSLRMSHCSESCLICFASLSARIPPWWQLDLKRVDAFLLGPH